MQSIVLIIAALIVLAAVSYGFSKSEKPVLFALKSAVTGISALLFVNITSNFTGCYIAVNYYTAFMATVLSLPGVISLLIVNIIFS